MSIWSGQISSCASFYSSYIAQNLFQKLQNWHIWQLCALIVLTTAYDYVTTAKQTTVSVKCKLQMEYLQYLFLQTTLENLFFLLPLYIST